MIDEQEYRFAIEHFRRRAAAQERAAALVGGFERGSFKLPGTRIEREEYARKRIEAFRALRDAGRYSLPEFLQAAGYFALTIVYEHREMEGYYASELDPIIERIRAVEQAHGLAEGEYWPIGEGPEEWQQLNLRYDALEKRQQIAVLREFNLDDLAAILESDAQRFEEFWLRGVSAVDEFLPPPERLTQLISNYRDESARAEAAGALHAAAAMRGAVLEGLLLLRCINNPIEVEQAVQAMPAGERPRGLPTNWTLGQLVKIGIRVGWLAVSDVEGHGLDLTVYTRLVGDLRNMLHPGRRLRLPAAELTEEELADARAAIVIIEAVLEDLEERG